MYWLRNNNKWWKGSKKKWIDGNVLPRSECSLLRTVKHVDKAWRLFGSMPSGSILFCTKSKKYWTKK